MLSLILVATVLQHASEHRVEVRAVRADVAMRKIGEEFGEEIEVGPDFGDDIILVSLRSVTFEELKAKTSKAFRISWEETEDGWRAFRTEEQRQQEIDEMLARRDEKIEQVIDVAPLVLPPSEISLQKLEDAIRLGTEDEIINSVRVGKLGLDDRLKARIVSNVLANTFQSVPINTRKTWSFGDSRFPAIDLLQGEVDRYNTEAKTVYDLVDKYQLEARLISRDGRELDWMSAIEMFGGGREIQTLYLTIRSNHRRIVIQILGFDAERKLALFANTSIGHRAHYPWIPEIPSEEIRVDRNADSRGFIEDLIEAGNQKNVPAIRDKILAFPEEDFWGMDGSEILLAFARESSSDVLALLSDTYLPSTLGIFGTRNGQYRESTLTLESGLRWLAKMHFLSYESSQLIMRPLNAEPFRTAFDRDELKVYAQSTTTSNWIDLDSLADCMGAFNDPERNGLFTTMALFHRDLLHVNGNFGAVLEFYANLGRSRRRAARSEAGYLGRFSEFGYAPESFTEEEFLVGSVGRIFPGIGTFSSSYQPTLSDVTLAADFEKLSRSGQIWLRVSESDHLFGFESEDSDRRYMGIEKIADDIAAYRYYLPDQTNQKLQGYMFRVALIASLESSLRFSGKTYEQDEEQIVLGFYGEVSVPFDDLPQVYKDSFWEAVRKAEEEIRKSQVSLLQ